MPKPRTNLKSTEVIEMLKAVNEETLRIGGIIAKRMTAKRFGRIGTGIISVFGERLHGLYMLQSHLKALKSSGQKDIPAETKTRIQQLMEAEPSTVHNPKHLLYTAETLSGEERRSNERLRKIAGI